MNKTVTLEIPQSEWKKFNEELVRAVAVMQEQQRESEERWERIAKLQAESEKIKQQIREARENVEKYLGGD
jgi:peptidoglycan hydrolase CwlO-like protein